MTDLEDAIRQAIIDWNTLGTDKVDMDVSAYIAEVVANWLGGPR